MSDFKKFNTNQEQRVQDLTKKQMDFIVNMNNTFNDQIAKISSDFDDFTSNCREQMNLLSEGQSFLSGATHDFKIIKLDIETLKKTCEEISITKAD
jgi:hypothetical protein